MSLLAPNLLAFIAITKHKTVHGAAHELHLTQTAITQRIRSLERLLQTTLFIRSRRGMLLTPEGEALLRYCHAAQTLEKDTLIQIKGAGTLSDITLSICAPTSIMTSRIIPQCLPVMQKFRRLLIHFNVNDSENRHQTLRSAQADFAVISLEQASQEMAKKTLESEEYVLVCSPAWKNRKLVNIIEHEKIIDFDESDSLTFNYLKTYGLFHLVKNHRHFVNRTDNLALLTSKGLGYTTLAKEFAAPYLKNKTLILLNQGKTYKNTPILAWYNRPETPDYFSAIIEAIC